MISLLLSKYKAYIYLAVIAAICSGSFIFGKKVGANEEFARMSKEVKVSQDNLYACKDTVIEMNMQATTAIVSQQVKINEVAQDANKQIQELETHVDNAASIADRLREQLKKALRDGIACKSTTSSGNGSDETGNLFADLYSRSVEESRVIAEYADKVTIAHQACLNSH
jgi:hypothetical protein